MIGIERIVYNTFSTHCKSICEKYNGWREIRGTFIFIYAPFYGYIGDQYVIQNMLLVNSLTKVFKLKNCVEVVNFIRKATVKTEFFSYVNK